MTASFGRITAHLAEPVEDVSDELVVLINENIRPPEPIEASDVFVRAMYVVSDDINSFGGRFPADEHRRLASLLIDAPLMVGHRKDRLPVGRNFHAAIVEKDGRQWVKSYFYWVKTSDDAHSLKENIDKGVYKECSIGFTYLFPECSVCGDDMRSCDHQPLEKVRTDKGEVTAHFNYRQIEKVLETSLVYRGALPDTAVTKELGLERLLKFAMIPEEIKDLSQLPDVERFLVVPCYESLPVRISSNNGSLNVESPDGTRCEKASAEFKAVPDLPEFPQLPAQLIGLRGKQRCSVNELRKYLEDKPSQVTRLELKMLPFPTATPVSPELSGGSNRISTIRHVRVSREELPAAIRSISTRAGVLIWPNTINPADSCGYRYRLENPDPSAQLHYEIASHMPHNCHLFIIGENEQSCRFLIRHFELNRLQRGARFIIDADNRRHETDQKPATIPSTAVSLEGNIEGLKKHGEGYILTMSGALKGLYAIKPIKLDGLRRYLFYRIDIDSRRHHPPRATSGMNPTIHPRTIG